MREETERLSKLPTVTQLVVDSGNVIVQVSFSFFYKTALLIKAG